MVNVARLGEVRWNRANTWMFVSFTVGMLLEAYIFGLASIATGWVAMPKSLTSLLLAWAPIWLIVGIALAGPISDRMGRKGTFYLTMALYGIGAIGLVFSYSYVLILVFLAILLLAAGGEMNTIMVASHELMPRRHRGKTMMMEINAINLGGFLLAAVALLSAYSTVSFQRTMIGVTAIVVLLVLLVARRNMPESIRWLEQRGRNEEAAAQVREYYGADWEAHVETQPERAPAARAAKGPHPSTALKMVVMIVIAAANTIGFGLVAYTLGPKYYPHLTSTILLVTTGVGFVAGFFGLLADRISRKGLLFWTFLGTFVMTAILWLTTGAWSRDLTLFWILIVLLSAVNSVCYLTEDTIKAEVWPTLNRGTLTAVARFISIGLYIPAIYLAPYGNVHAYFFFNTAVWFVGLLAAFVWLVKGNETGQGVSIDVASGETAAS